jgi:TRAP-type C4-dicarboxylate transport system permease small subunit
MRCRVCGNELDAGGTGMCPQCGTPAGSRFIRSVCIIEDTVITVMLCTMVLLVLLQIVLRNVYFTGIPGAAEMVRHLVLWVAFLGAGIAAREGKHIRIDAVHRILPESLKYTAEVLTGLFTTIICAILFYASLQFVRTDFGLGTTIGFLNCPVWILEVVIPVGYGIVTLRYGAQSMESFLKLLRN